MNSIVPAAIPLPKTSYEAIPTPPPPPPQSDYENPSRQTYNPNQKLSIEPYQHYLPSRCSREAMFASVLPLPSQYGSVLPLPSQYGSVLPLPLQYSQLSINYTGEQPSLSYTTNPLLPTQLVQIYDNKPNPLSYLGSTHITTVTTTQEVTSGSEEPKIPPTTPLPNAETEAPISPKKEDLDPKPSSVHTTTSLRYIIAHNIITAFKSIFPDSEEKETKTASDTTSQTPPVLIKNQETPPESSTPSKVPTLIRSDNSQERYTQLSPDSGRQIAQAG